jgi:hypothetical protein
VVRELVERREPRYFSSVWFFIFALYERKNEEPEYNREYHAAAGKDAPDAATV